MLRMLESSKYCAYVVDVTASCSCFHYIFGSIYRLHAWYMNPVIKWNQMKVKIFLSFGRFDIYCKSIPNNIRRARTFTTVFTAYSWKVYLILMSQRLIKKVESVIIDEDLHTCFWEKCQNWVRMEDTKITKLLRRCHKRCSVRGQIFIILFRPRKNG